MSEKTYEQTTLKGVQFELDPYANMGFGEHEGYTFSGWRDASETHVYADKQSVTFNEDTDLYAIWQINQYTQTFNLNGGRITSGSSTVTQDYGTALTPPQVAKTGYSLNGWTPQVPQTVPASNNTYTAQWTANTATVEFCQDSYIPGGSLGGAAMLWDEVTVTYDAPMPTMPSGAPRTKTGYTFKGFFDAHGGAGTKYYDENGNSARNWDKPNPGIYYLFNYFTANNYQVSFNLGYSGATNTPPSQTVTFDQPYGTLPVPVRTGYIFDGWYNGNTQVTESTQVTTPSNHTLTAHWSDDLITITFHENFDVEETISESNEEMEPEEG